MNYKNAIFGGIVDVKGTKGVIVGFDESNDLNTKVVYETGGYDWFKRDELEKNMIVS